MKRNHRNRVYDSEWTTEPPMQTGLYKVENRNSISFWAYYTEGFPYIQIFGDAAKINVDFIARWLGPLPEPELPKKEG